MALIYYGTQVQIALDAAAIKHVREAVAAHASRGGWVTVTDIQGREWSFLVSAGIPIWIDESG